MTAPNPIGHAATYRNPVLDADWSDPDAIRVGDDYFLTASSFNRVPGLPVLHSRDLVNWRLLGYAVPRLVPEEHYRLPRHGGGIWAPALRFHEGRFFIFYPDPDHGIFVVHAEDPAGPWSEPHLIYSARGIIDPCPFWDDDGRAYLAHAWAKTRAGFWNRITVHEMAPDASRLIGAGRTVIDGDRIPGFRVLEGPKVHRREGWYWIFAPAGTVPIGWQSVFRSRDIWGPYEERTVLAQGTTDINGPHQGAWVEATDGSDWFLHFQDRGPVGRVVHLQPMSWGEDGWPRMGTAVDNAAQTGAGEPVREHSAPPAGVAGEPPRWSGALPPGWHWQANPDDGWVREWGNGRVVLTAVDDDPVNLRELPHVLAQRLPGQPFEATVHLRLDAHVPGTRAGMVLLGSSYCWVGLRLRPGGTFAVEAATGGEARDEFVLASTVVGSDRVELRVRVDDTATATLAWRWGDGSWHDVPTPVALAAGKWIGTELGVFATSPISDGRGLPAAHFEGLKVSLENGGSALRDTQSGGWV